jgi:hypothetical protein
MARKKPPPPPEPPPPDPDQTALDLQDAQQRLNRLRDALAAKQTAEEAVLRAKTALARAKRLLVEAGWNLTSALQSERRRYAPPEPLRSDFEPTRTDSGIGESDSREQGELPL